jgi:hypothetical protein
MPGQIVGIAGLLFLGATEIPGQHDAGNTSIRAESHSTPAKSPLDPATKSPQSIEVEFTSSNLPIVVIDTHGQTIVDEPKIMADMKIIYNGEGIRNDLTDTLYHYNGKIGIEIRGSSSQMFPKKQYAIETRDEQGENLDASLLGFPADNDWILSAPYSDKSMLRNVLACKLANDLGRYASRTKFCELVLNGDYRGVYVLMEKIKRGKQRVNITKINATDVSGDAVSGGYLFKIDKIEGAATDGWRSPFPPYAGASQRIYYQYHYPAQDAITPEQKTYLQGFVSIFETMMSAPAYTNPQTGYPASIDVDSFVDFFILNESAKNVDGYRLSTFLYKDRNSVNGKLCIGPIWDFDLAYGNANYYGGSIISGWQVDFQVRSDNFQIPFWWRKLIEDSAFVNGIECRWQASRREALRLDRLHAFIDSTVSYLDDAQKRNFERWPILGTYVWPNAYVGQSYAEEIAYLKRWLEDRILWMDAQLVGFCTTEVSAAPAPQPEIFALQQNYPNPFNPSTTIAFHLLHPELVSLKLFDVLGREVATVMQQELPSGKHEVKFDGAALASGAYFYRLQAGEFTATKKLLIVR